MEGSESSKEGFPQQQEEEEEHKPTTRPHNSGCPTTLGRAPHHHSWVASATRSPAPAHRIYFQSNSIPMVVLPWGVGSTGLTGGV
mmetsp:Transcript_61002/g.69114  ORF Transcript_61002/g.69114 Transcript_61002/m.69114 type:complete len:85 (+) Transcript_61002:867-1121(+)